MERVLKQAQLKEESKLWFIEPYMLFFINPTPHPPPLFPHSRAHIPRQKRFSSRPTRLGTMLRLASANKTNQYGYYLFAKGFWTEWDSEARSFHWGPRIASGGRWFSPALPLSLSTALPLSPLQMQTNKYKLVLTSSYSISPCLVFSLFPSLCIKTLRSGNCSYLNSTTLSAFVQPSLPPTKSSLYDVSISKHA